MPSLATLAQYKASNTLNATAQDGTFPDAQLQAFLDQATAYFENTLCQQPIQSTTETIVFGDQTMLVAINNQGGLDIYPPFFPIISVTSIGWRIAPGDTFTLFAATDYFVQEYLRKIVIPFANPLRRRQFGEVQLIYTHGYATIPNDVVEAVIALATAFASLGMGVIDMAGRKIQGVIPEWQWKMIEATAKNYKRRV